ncbi:MAG TPA: hypothetical protein VEL07_02920 [Planctomycetota bacterium]|nr:hypothetical protein [Planctomycetota bacterium]
MSNPHHARRGSALVMITMVLMTLAVIAVALTDSAVRRHRDHEQRQRQLEMSTACESAINMAFAYFESSAGTQALADMAVGDVDSVPIVDVEGKGLSAIADADVFVDIMKLSMNMFRLRAQAAMGDRTSPETFRRLVYEVGAVRKPTQFGNAGLMGYMPMTGGGSLWGTSLDSNPANVTAIKTDMMNQTMDDVAGTAEDESLRKGPRVFASDVSVSLDKPGDNIDPDCVWGHYDMPNITVAYLPPAGADAVEFDDGKGKSGPPQDLLVGESYRASEWLGGTVNVVGAGTAYLYIDGAIDLCNISVTYSDPKGVLEVRQGNPVDIDDMNFNGNAVLNPGVPKQFVLISAFEGSMTFNGTAGMNAVIIAPKASLKLKGNNSFYGSMIVHGVTKDAGGNATVTYDPDTAGMSFPDLGPLTTTSWRALEPGYGKWTMDDAIYVNNYIDDAK